MRGGKKSGLLKVGSLVVAWLAVAPVSQCAQAKRGAVGRVERGGVRAWVITPGAIPTQGPFAQAKPGDLALGDGDIIVVVSRQSRGGQWIDVAHTADKGYDYLRYVIPIYDQQEALPYDVTSAEIRNEAPAPRPAIEISGRDRKRPRLELRTRLELLPTSHAILLTTSWHNGTSETVGPLVPGDRIGWGTDNVFAPYAGNLWRPSMVELSGDWLTWFCSWQDHFSMGVTPPKGAIRALFGKTDARLFYDAERRLEPGADFVYRRYFPVSDHQMDATPRFALGLRGQTLGWLEGEVRETGTDKAVGNCRVELLSSTRLPAPLGGRPLMWTYTDEAGRFRAALPAGRYFAWTEKAVGRRGPGAGTSVDVTSGETTRCPKPLPVSPQAILTYDVRDAETGKPLPCKITFEPFPQMAPVDFGPDWHGPGARNVYYCAPGQSSLNAPVGRYRLTVSHGPEYELAVVEKEMVVTSENRLEVRLKRAIRLEEAGLKDYVSVDLGVRTSASPDCLVRPTDRVLSAAAEGVQCLVTGDVGAATDLTSAIRATQLGDSVSAICGRRVDWRGPGGRGGEMLVFPTPPGSVPPAQLQRESEAASPERFVRTLRRAYPKSLLSLCCPMAAERGYVRSLGFTIDVSKPSPVVPREAMAFNLYELFTSTDRNVGDNHQMYARLLREGWRYGPVAGSDSHYLRGQECGYPRLYVARSPKAGSSLLEQIHDGLTSGRVLVTNGPFIRLLVNGRPPGSFVRATGGKVDILFEVRAAPWVDVRGVSVYDGEFPYRQLFLPPSTQLMRFPKNETESPEFTMQIKHDVIITGIAVGSSPLAPVVTQDDPRGFAAYPFAVTGPIYVDYDGDGKCTPPNPFLQRPSAPF